LIVDNVLIVFAISRAYDRVSWIFVQSMMRKMGFHEKLINLTGVCIINVKYQVFVNDDNIDLQNSGRGLQHVRPSIYVSFYYMCWVCTFS